MRCFLPETCALLLLATPAAAQFCSSSGPGLALTASAARTQQQVAGRATGWSAGATLERAFNSGTAAARLGYHQENLGSTALHTGSIALARRIGRPHRTCLTIDALLTLGTGLGSADDVFRNLTVPAGVVLVRPGAVAPFAGIHAIVSATDARLLSYRIRTYSIGYGGLAGARIAAGPFHTELSVRATQLGGRIGPQPLGRFRAGIGFGLRL